MRPFKNKFLTIKEINKKVKDLLSIKEKDKEKEKKVEFNLVLILKTLNYIS